MEQKSFRSRAIAAGYATARPAVHPIVVRKAWAALAWTAAVDRALDLGCGAGVSTRALDGLAAERVGLEPVAAMLEFAPEVAPGARFVAGRAEDLPFVNGAFDVITAAGSLNYVDLDRAFAQASRVLRPGGMLVAYDFEAGRSFRDDTSLDEWFEQFTTRYPYPAGERQVLSPDVLAVSGKPFLPVAAEEFAIALTLTPAFFLDYILTETNVAAAVSAGAPLEDVRAWCALTLAPIWDAAPREVLFRGYYACLAVR